MKSRQERIGEAILQERGNSDLASLSMAQTATLVMGLQEFDPCPSESIGMLTAQAYLDELKLNPAPQAKEMYDHLTKGVEIDDDPGGN